MSLRIRRPDGDTFDKWMERLVKLIPGEIVPVYTLVREQGNDFWMTQGEGKGLQWISAGISSIAFIF